MNAVRFPDSTIVPVSSDQSPRLTPGKALPVLASCLLTCWLPSAGTASELVPYDTPSLNPLIQIFGVSPSSASAFGADEGFTLSLQQDIANSFSLEGRGGDGVIVDGELWRTQLGLGLNLTDQWRLDLRLPFLRHRKGILDATIDDWHRWFGFPDGGRDKRPRQTIRYWLRDQNRVLMDRATESEGLGDARLNLRYRMPWGERSLFLGTEAKLPTGDADDLTGSGGLDLSLSALLQDGTTLAAWNLTGFAGAGITYLGTADTPLANLQQRWVWSTRLGGGWEPLPGLRLKAQLDHHSAVYDSPLRTLGGQGLQLTAGIDWRLLPATDLELALSEDLATKVTPDITLTAGLRQRF